MKYLRNRRTGQQFFDSDDEVDNEVELSGESSIHLAMKKLESRLSEPTLWSFLQNVDDANACDNELNTPLHYCAHTLDTKLARILIAHGAELSVKNRYGNTPLQHSYVGRNKWRSLGW